MSGEERWVIIIFVIVLALGTFLRIYRIGMNSLWYDEATTSYIASPTNMSITDFLLRRVQSVVTLGPAYYFLVRAFLLLGQTEFALRLPSAIAGVLAVVCTYQVARIYFDSGVALLSSLLLSLSVYHIYFSQEARPHAMQMLFGLGSTLVLVRILRDRRPLKWALYVLITALGFYFHILLYMGLIVLAQGTFVVLTSRGKSIVLREWLLAQVGILILLFPWLAIKLPLVLQILIGTSGSGWSPQLTRVLWPAPTTMLLREIAWAFIAGRYFDLSFLPWIGQPLSNVPDIGAWSYRILLLVHTVVVIKGIVQYLGGQLIEMFSPFESGRTLEINPNVSKTEGVVLFLSYLVIPLAIMYVVSFQFRLLTERHAYIVFPAFVILVALGVSSFKSRTIKTMLIVGFLVVNGISLTNYYFNPQHQKEQWRDVAKYVEAWEQPGDVIIFYADYVQRAFDYYYQGNAEKAGLEVVAELEKDEGWSRLQPMIEGHERVWLVLAHAFGSGKEVYGQLLDEHCRLSEQRKFKGIQLGLYEGCSP